MAVYTHFGSMDEVRRAVRRDGFARLEADLDAVPPTDDPVADLAAAGAAYFANGLAHPELYRAMFVDRPPETAGDDPGAAIFARLADAVARCIDAGRFQPAQPAQPAQPVAPATGWAAEVWTMCHGMVLLAQTGQVPVEQVASLLADMTHRLAVGYGDDRAAAEESVRRGQGSRYRPSTR
jgi:AcrR family transcriptional regulator